MENLEIKRRLAGKNILITGATGFIGARLAEKAAEAGSAVSAVVKKGDDRRRIKHLAGAIKIFETDIGDIAGMRECFAASKPSAVLHLAAMRNPARDIALIYPHIEVNLVGTLNLLQAAADTKTKMDIFVNTGTCEEYGDGETPFRESQREIPVSPYSASKTAATYFCRMLAKSFGVPVVTLRPFLTYGPGQDPDMFVPSLIEHCLENRDFEMTSGEQTREFNYVDDVAEAFLLAAVSDGIAGEIINVGNGKEYKIREVAEKIIAMTGSRTKLKIGALAARTGEAEHFYCDNSKAAGLLGWSPTTTLDEGLKKTIAWHMRNAARRRD